MQFVTHTALAYVWLEVVFFSGHRLMHTKYFYEKFHRIHHEYRYPVAGASFYNHPVEMAIVNLPSGLGGVLLLGSHAFMIFTWMAWNTYITVVDHSGYHFPLHHSPQFHMYHHLNPTENFGSHGWMDNLFGTNRAYHKSVNAKRDHIFCSLTPIHELIK